MPTALRLLDFAGRDVLPTGLDHFLLAVNDGEVAVVVEHAEVAGLGMNVSADGQIGQREDEEAA